MQLDLAPDGDDADRGGHVHALADRALQPLRSRSDGERQDGRGGGGRDRYGEPGEPQAAPPRARQHALRDVVRAGDVEARLVLDVERQAPTGVSALVIGFWTDSVSLAESIAYSTVAVGLLAVNDEFAYAEPTTRGVPGFSAASVGRQRALVDVQAQAWSQASRR